MTRLALVFPPGWTFISGAPHLALPSLKAFLEKEGVEVICTDLNWLVGREYDAHISAKACAGVVTEASLAKMNVPYFSIEDRLMREAAAHGGTWNAQTGFEYRDLPQESSSLALSALDRGSPYNLVNREFIQSLNSLQPDVVGFCLAATQQIVPALQLIKAMREGGYDGHVVLGGNTISRLAAEMATPGLFDLVNSLITFQGELPLLRLCQAIQRGDSLESVPNLIWYDGKVVKRNANDVSVHPNDVPCPNYDDLPIGRYAGENYLNIVSARGCYYGKCSFCAIPYGWGTKGFAGARTVENTYQDMLSLMDRHGVDRFKFVDEALSPRFMRLLSERILADGVSVRWEGYTRLESAWEDTAFVALVGKAGFRKGYFGLEILPTTSRTALNKSDGASPDALLERCADSGIKAHLFCMFGFPGTGEDEAQETLAFLLDNVERIDTADIFPWTYAKHTSVHSVHAVTTAERDWALEFPHEGNGNGILASNEVLELASRCEEVVWAEAPKLLHPIYRLLSPWHDLETAHPSSRINAAAAG